MELDDAGEEICDCRKDVAVFPNAGDFPVEFEGFEGLGEAVLCRRGKVECFQEALLVECRVGEGFENPCAERVHSRCGRSFLIPNWPLIGFFPA